MPVVGERGLFPHRVRVGLFHAPVGTECDGRSHPTIGFLDARCLIPIC